MTRYLVFLLACLSLGPPLLRGQSSNSNGPWFITSTQTASISVGAASTVGIQVTGTWTGTLQPQVAIAGQAGVNTAVYPTGSTTSQTTITANGFYTMPAAGATTFLLVGNTVSSGTAVIYLSQSTGTARGPASGGGGGAVSSVSGTANQVTVSPTTGATVVSLPAEVDLGVAGTSTGILGLNGATSGKATITAPAVAGTATNPISITNSLQLPSGTVYNWNNDTGLSRDSAGVVDVGNGTAGNKSGTINAAVVSASSSVSTGSSTVVACAGATGCEEVTEASVACTPTAGRDCKRGDSTAHSFKCSLNGGTETACDPLITNDLGGTAAAPTIVSTHITGFTTNFLPKFNASGNVVPSLCDEGVTTANTITCTDTNGIAGVKFTATGATAGYYAFPQGSTSVGAIPATSILEQAPAAVTSYSITKPGAAPTLISYKRTDTCPVATQANCTESFQPASIVLRVTADFTDASATTLQAITGLSFTFPANLALNAKIDCDILYNQTVGAVSDAWGVQDVTVAPTNVEATGFTQTAATTWSEQQLLTLATTTATNIGTFTPSAITTVWHAQLHSLVEHPSNASTSVFQIMVSQSTAADLMVIKRGSSCLVTFQ
jgi:hypothetical protein